MSPPSILSRKIIMSPPSISPPAHADLPLHVTSQTVNQLGEEVPCLCRQSVHPRPLEVVLCCRCQSYQEKSSCCCRQSVCLRTLICPSHVSSRTVNHLREEALCLCRQSFHPRPVEVALCCRRQSYQEKALFSAINQSALARRLAVARN